jgi:hypothetical protein
MVITKTEWHFTRLTELASHYEKSKRTVNNADSDSWPAEGARMRQIRCLLSCFNGLEEVRSDGLGTISILAVLFGKVP